MLRKKWRHLVVSLVTWLFIANLMTESICIYKATLGIPCPGCGMTRALTAFVKGDYPLAFHMHPLWPMIVIGCLIGLWVLATRKEHLIQQLSLGKQANRLWLFVFAVVFFVYVLRMIFYFPHTEPMTFNDKAILPQIYKIFIIH